MKIRPTVGAAATAVAALALLLAAPASGQQPVAEPSASEAAAALEEAQAALSPGPGPETPSSTPAIAPDPTTALNQLAAAYPQLTGDDRRLAKGLLARPTDGAADQYGDGYAAGAPVLSVESDHFCVFWVNDPGSRDAPSLADANLNGVPDYVDSIAAIAERSYGVEVTPGPLGWQPPKPDTTGCGADPSTRSDVYLEQLGNQQLFGYESPDPGQGSARSQYGYMVLDNDYAPAEYGYADPAIPASVTFAHEFNHLLQQNYDSFEDVWMFESTAVWAEEKVFPAVNDYINYVPSFARNPGDPITDRKGGGGLKIYGSAVWNHWLDSGGGGYGDAAVRRAWEVSDSVDPADFAVAAYDKAIRNGGGRSFSREFSRFAAATAEWRTGFGGFPDATAYPDVRRDGSMHKRSHKHFKLDHTAYRLLSVQPGSGDRLKLKLDAGRGVRCGVALVARQGDPVGGSVVLKTRYLDNGGKAAITLQDPQRFARITAVVTNADGRVTGLTGDDWAYSRDGRPFDISLTG